MNQIFYYRAFNETWSALRLSGSHWVTQVLLRHFQQSVGINGISTGLEKGPQTAVNKRHKTKNPGLGSNFGHFLR